jgi:serine/threonine-protein kinase RsbW
MLSTGSHTINDAAMHLGLRAQPENVALVRQALIGLADVLGMDAAILADMKTAVSEACNNVVVHAYDGEDGPLEVEITPLGAQVVVVVRDQGRGIRPAEPPPDSAVQGVGLALITALTDSVEFHGGVGNGTEVRMTFDAERTLAALVPVARVAGWDSNSSLPDGDIRIVIAAGPLVGPVLGRVIAMLAARANFSIDRLSDAQLVSDALSAHAPAYLAGSRIGVAIEDADRSLDLRIGPLVSEGGRELVRASELPGVGPLLQQLSDEVAVERANGSGAEFLRLRLADRT